MQILASLLSRAVLLVLGTQTKYLSAACKRQILRRLFQGVIDLITIHDIDSGITFQKLSSRNEKSFWSADIHTGQSVFQIHLSETIEPHIIWGFCQMTVIVYKH